MVIKVNAMKIGILLYFFSSTVFSGECDRNWALEGAVKSKNYIVGIGLSSKINLLEAQKEAKVSAIKDISQQLQSSVKSESKISEDQNGSSYNGTVEVSSSGQDLVGLKLTKESKDPANNITYCAAFKFDVSAVYLEEEGRMNVLLKSLEEISKLAKDKKYIEILQKKANAKKLISESADRIKRADMFRAFLNTEDKSWYEKIKNIEIEVDKVAELAKSNITFILSSNSSHEILFADLESRLSDEGFDVLRDPKAGRQVKIFLDVKDIGTPRKSKTALGETLIAKIIVNIKDQNGKVYSSNKGGTITGTAPTEEEAIANVDRQLLVNVLDTLKSGLPGLLKDE
jgi:hypothetical protein